MISLLTSSVIATLLSLFPAQATTYTISGQVLDNVGKAHCGVRVCALPADFDPNKRNTGVACAMSDERGQFTMAVKKPGRYKLVYDYAAQGFQSTFHPFFRQPSIPLPEVLVDDNNVSPSITITMLPKNGVLAGKGVDTQTGLPVESMEFKLCHATIPDVCWTINAKNSVGYFSIATPQVPFTLRIKSEGFEDWLGLNGDRDTPLTVAPETKVQLGVFLKRSAASTGKAVSDSEKQVGFDLPAPVQLSPANDAVYDRYPRWTKLEWSPVEGAVSYKIEVDYCDGSKKNRATCVDPQPHALTTNSPTFGIVSTTYEFRFVGAQPGRWRVWAVDKEGREGFRSPWRRFLYLQ